MKSFGCMVTNGGSEILEVSPSASRFAALLGVRATCLPIDLAKHFCPPPLVQSFDALLELADLGNRIFAFAIKVETTAKLV
ncbi:hypothetical protein [Bradyrhizobium genosp. SA-3]|uniref:hypothetical protein n=1 Tax=Bradyrhizobium genosp. SA-3 TaxID=508868 RepID=UPI001FE060FA|nr:hypothetical protein [Bradyrhizobium genosp. SA-3]